MYNINLYQLQLEACFRSTSVQFEMVVMTNNFNMLSAYEGAINESSHQLKPFTTVRSVWSKAEVLELSKPMVGCVYKITITLS